MQFRNRTLNKFWRFSSSFQLGIPIMLVISVLIAWGTIVESRYDAFTAKKLVYDSWLMWLAMVLLVYNLTIVVIDRWPWQSKHFPFITVHAGIIILIFGSYITSRYGVDGQLLIPIGGKGSLVSLGQHTDIVVYATFDGDRFSKVVDREVDFFEEPPTSANPYVIDLNNDKIEILEYIKYARLQNKIKPSTDIGAGASVRFQLFNANVKEVQQITQSRKNKVASYNFGPAQVHLGEVPAELIKNPHTANQLYLTPTDGEHLSYTILYQDPNRKTKKGQVKIGDVLSTGWMGLELRILDYMLFAEEDYEVTALERPTPLTTAVVKIKHKDKEQYLALNDVVKLFGSQSAYLMSYQNRRIDMGFELKLNNFEVTRYQGSLKAMEYASQVSIEQTPINLVTISMNEPLKHAGYTIYQASFQEDEVTGKPVASVFSINKDPGRAIKYFGSLVFSFGVIWLFYQRRKRATAI